MAKRTPEHGTPLRSWFNASYGANGRAWSSTGQATDGSDGAASDHTTLSDHDLLGKKSGGAPRFDWCDKNRTQGPQPKPVKDDGGRAYDNRHPGSRY